jgi:ribosomal protein S18 acetylase RimI-like enzyme
MSTPSIDVSIASEPSPELIDALTRLLPQLSSSAAPPTGEAVAEIVGSPATTLLVARDGDAILGALTLVLFRIPTGVRAWIEDVVVDAEARGRGVGEALTRAAVARALERGAKTVDLTSRRSRTAAHRLYEKVGFAVRETSVYRYEPDR